MPVGVGYDNVWRRQPEHYLQLVCARLEALCLHVVRV